MTTDLALAALAVGYVGERWLWGLTDIKKPPTGGDMGTRTPGHEIQRLWHTHFRERIQRELDLPTLPESVSAAYRTWRNRHVQKYGAIPGAGDTAGGAVPAWEPDVARAAARLWAGLGMGALEDQTTKWSGTTEANGPGDVGALGRDIAFRVTRLQQLAGNSAGAEPEAYATAVRWAVFALVVSIDGAGAGSYGWRELDNLGDFMADKAHEVANDLQGLAWKGFKGTLGLLSRPLAGAAVLAGVVYIARRRGVL